MRGGQIALVYAHIFLGLLITTLSVEFIKIPSPGHTVGDVLIIIAEVILLFVLLFYMLSAPPGPLKYIAFGLFAVLLGQTMINSVNKLEQKGIVREVVASVAGIFLGMTIVGFIDNNNFLGFSGYFLAALVGLILARITLAILGLGGVNTDFWNQFLSWAGTILFSLFVAMDTQQLKQRIKGAPDYINLSLSLFLDIINLFENVGDIS